MIVRISSAKDGAVNFDTVTHTIIKIPFYALKEIDKEKVKPTLCFFCKRHGLIIALLEVSINHKVKYEISFIDRKNLDDLQDYFSAAIGDNNKATVENIDTETLDELISLRWLKMPLNKIGARKYYNKTSITKNGLESLDKELFIEQLKGEIQNTLTNDNDTDKPNTE